jgi:hypothetical protein
MFLRMLSIPFAVAVTAIGLSGKVMAADQAAAPAIAATPTMVSDFKACESCNSAAAACDSCSKLKGHLHLLGGCGHKKCTPYQTTLCPGACFGYFQTQWHRWENVCPIPYQGVGLTDAPLRNAPAATAPVIPTVPTPKTGSSDTPLPKVPTIPGK